MPRTLVALLCLASLLIWTATPAAATGDGEPRPGECERLARSVDFLDWLEANDSGGGGFFEHFFRYWRRLVQGRIETRLVNRCVHLNELQVLGSHNSYHVEPRPDLLDVLLIFSSEFLAWQYEHLPLGQQFSEQGIRQIELDVFADPEGGLYAQRRGLLLVQEDPTGPTELLEPGTKVLHVQDVDFDTTCLDFIACLQAVKSWSDAHPKHLPLAVLVEAKDEPIIDPLLLGFTVPLPFDSVAFRDVDAEIRSVFPEHQLLTPDDVRGDAASLEEAILTQGWPRIGEMRGRVLFLLDNAGEKREAYRDGALSLEGRVLFTNSTPGEPDAAFVKANDPLGDPTLIPDLVGAGYLVRTRADADTEQARSGDTTQRDAALASGAHFVSTDYPAPDPRFGDYVVEIPGDGVARCNPVNAPSGCRSRALEPQP